MNTRSLAALAAGFLILTAAPSCTPPKASNGDNITAARIMETVRENHKRIHTIRANGRLSVETPSLAQSVSFTLCLLKPDTLLVRLTGPFGMKLGALLLTPDRFTFYNSIDNVAVSGTPSAENLRRIINLSLSYHEILSLFSGGDFLATDTREPDSFSVDDDDYLMTYTDRTGTRMYWIDPDNLQIVRIKKFDQANNLLLEQRFGDLRDREQQALVPNTIQLLQERDGRYASIAYAGLLVNTGEMDLSFELPGNVSHRQVQ